jgi:hypothetical protein
MSAGAFRARNGSLLTANAAFRTRIAAFLTTIGAFFVWFGRASFRHFHCPPLKLGTGLAQAATNEARFGIGSPRFMEEPAETREETKHSRGFGRFVVWVGTILVLYVLSLGPLAMLAEMMQKRNQPLPGWLYGLYIPVTWAYEKTSLHKPLGMYFHLWCPSKFDKDGEYK